LIVIYTLVSTRLPTKECWRQKTRFPELLCGVVYVILGLTILVVHWLVSDRWTDRWWWQVPC